MRILSTPSTSPHFAGIRFNVPEPSPFLPDSPDTLPPLSIDVFTPTNGIGIGRDEVWLNQAKYGTSESVGALSSVLSPDFGESDDPSNLGIAHLLSVLTGPHSNLQVVEENRQKTIPFLGHDTTLDEVFHYVKGFFNPNKESRTPRIHFSTPNEALNGQGHLYSIQIDPTPVEPSTSSPARTEDDSPAVLLDLDGERLFL